MVKIILALIYLITSTSGLLLFKLGNNQVKTIIAFQNGTIQFQIGCLSVLGLLCYIASFVTFMILLTKHHLTYLVPILNGCFYVLVLAGSAFILKEKTSGIAIIGSLLTIIGVLMVSFAKQAP
jgi:drug/metabolite transporter (DMT)-like permease